MSLQTNEHIGGSATARRPPQWRRAFLFAATVTLGVLTVAVSGVAFVDSKSGGATQLMLGPLISEQIVVVAMTLAFTMTASMLCAISAPSGWLVPIVIVRLLSFSAVLMALLECFFVLPAAVTPLVVEGCDSGYIVQEKSLLLVSSITIFEKDGLLVTPVTHTGADDGYQPFAEGAYDAWVEGNRIDGWFRFHSESAETQETFSLPLLKLPSCHT